MGGGSKNRVLGLSANRHLTFEGVHTLGEYTF